MLCDEDGLRITGDDVASGDKELTLSLLWNIFVHLQLPLLIDKTTIADEISKIGGFKMDSLNVINSTLMGILLNWIQDSHEPRGEKSIMSATDYTDAVHNFILSQKLTTLLGNFPEDQLNFHKLLGCGCQSLERRHSLTQRQSASSDTVVHNKERDIDTTKDAAKKFKAIQAWWRNMTEQNYRSSLSWEICSQRVQNSGYGNYT
ncbi:Utrophin [Gossypium arboreum]|uniref:Utrophin n=1 Tax=Gossypium arboreum TaxID=29729 RepID=A0A0B0PTY7_GOSAR|nr:Utrophin [Gossypium arboreum]